MAEGSLDAGLGDVTQQGGVSLPYNFGARLFVLALRHGVEMFLAEPERWNDILRPESDGEATVNAFLTREISQIRSAFATATPTIRMGYARTVDRWPLIVVEPAMESVYQEYVGEIIQHRTYGTVELHGGIGETKVTITVLSENSGWTLYLYAWAKYVLRSLIPWFEEQGLIDASFSSGGGIDPQKNYLPASLFIQAQTWTYKGQDAAVKPLPRPPSRLHLFWDEGAPIEGHIGGVTPEGGE